MPSLFYQGKGNVTTYWLLDAVQKPIHKPRSHRVPNGIPADSPLLSLPGFKSTLAGSSSSLGLRRSPSLRRSQFRSSQGSPVLKRWQKIEDTPRISRDSFHRTSFNQQTQNNQTIV